MSSPIVEVHNLRKTYGRKVAVADVSFAVAVGEIFGILGPNGSGKSTTVECIAGLRDADGGDIRVLGIDPQTRPELIREHVGVQFQEAGLHDKITVHESLTLFASFYDTPADVDELLTVLDLKDKRDAQFRSLSGGQKQRVSIALAGGDTNRDDPGKRTERCAHWATVAAAAIAAVSLIVSAIFSWKASQAANAALNESQSQAWGVAGAANCHNYREEVWALVKKHISEREIRAWFAAENGGIDNPYHKGKTKTSLADYENGCGHLNLLLAVLDPNTGPSERMLRADHIPPEALRG